MSSFHSSSRFALHCNIVYSCRLLESLLETKAFCLFPIKAFVVSSVPHLIHKYHDKNFFCDPHGRKNSLPAHKRNTFFCLNYSCKITFCLFSNVIYVFVGFKQVRTAKMMRDIFTFKISFRYNLKNEGHFVKVPIPQSLLS